MSNKQHGTNHRSAEQREIDGGGQMPHMVARMHIETALALVATARGMLMHARVKFPENEDRDLSVVMASVLGLLDAPYELMLDYSTSSRSGDPIHPLDAMIAASQTMANQVAMMWEDMNRMAAEREVTDVTTLQERKDKVDD